MMGASGRCSSRTILAAALVVTLAACVDERAPISGTTSLAVELIDPADPGSEDERLNDLSRSVTISVSALDAQGELDEGFSASVEVYAHYLGGLSPDLGDDPLISVELEDGQSDEVELELPLVYGATFLWVEDGGRDDATFATGTSPILWYRDPFLADVSRPIDESAAGALERSPLELKEIQVSDSRYGDDGRLVVTGVYSQGYTLSDVQCGEGGAPPCTTGDYDAVFVFSFNRPLGEGTGPIEVGDSIDVVSGAVTEFNGLTELGFPSSRVVDGERDPGRAPEPVVIQPEWLSGGIEMERIEAGLVAVEGGVVCALDEDFETFSQWKLDVGNGCGDPINVVTQGQVNDFEPAAVVGQVLPRVVGTLRPINIGSFHVWIMYPRDAEDLTLP
jgi:hypothetical protein